jgi:class 3 adenylate cyclase
MSQTRRLAAILAADVAGYSRLMGADEEGTHERLQAHLRELVDPKIKEHHGRTVKNTGDGFLAEFPSVLDAVRWLEFSATPPAASPFSPSRRLVPGAAALPASVASVAVGQAGRDREPAGRPCYRAGNRLR